MLNAFKDEDAVNKSFDVEVVDEKGNVEEGAGVGVARDLFSTFWQQLFSSAALGDPEKVPAVRHDYQLNQRTAMGNILVYGFEKLDFFPLGLSRAFVASCLFGDHQMTQITCCHHLEVILLVMKGMFLTKC